MSVSDYDDPMAITRNDRLLFFFVPIFGSFVLFFVFFFALRHPLSWQQKCNSGSVPQVDGGSLLKRVQQRKRETDVSRELGKRYVYSLEAREVV